MGNSKYPPWDPYERTRKDGGVIESLCVRCGHTMTATDVEQLVSHELKHLRECPERANRELDRERTG